MSSFSSALCKKVTCIEFIFDKSIVCYSGSLGVSVCVLCVGLQRQAVSQTVCPCAAVCVCVCVVVCDTVTEPAATSPTPCCLFTRPVSPSFDHHFRPYTAQVPATPDPLMWPSARDRLPSQQGAGEGEDIFGGQTQGPVTSHFKGHRTPRPVT